jgi:hypothetical protein
MTQLSEKEYAVAEIEGSTKPTRWRLYIAGQHPAILHL